MLTATTTQLTVAVPTGATTGKINVRVAGQTAISSSNFIVTLPAPTIISFSPTRGTVGTTVTINGTNFSATPSSNTVKFNSTTALVAAASTTQLTVMVPAGATSGTITVTVGTKTATSSTTFTVVPPTITVSTLSPNHGPIGTVVTITGSNFDPSPANNVVTFNGAAATVSSASATQLVVATPPGAMTGVVSVAADGGVGVSKSSYLVSVDGPAIAIDGPSTEVSTTNPGEPALLTFNGTAGQTLGIGISSVDIESSNPSAWVVVTIYDPNNQAVVNSSSCLTMCVFSLDDLPASGIYRVEVDVPADNQATIRLVATLSSAIEGSVAESSPYDVAQDRIGRIDKFTFSGMRGQTAALEFFVPADPYHGFHGSVGVAQPDGVGAGYCGAPWDPEDGICTGPILLKPLLESGNYSVFVQQTTDGTNVVMQTRLKTPMPVAIDGAMASNTNDYAWQVGLLSFAATAGQRLGLGMIVPITLLDSNSFAAHDLIVTIYDPDGTVLASNPHCQSLMYSVIVPYTDIGCGFDIDTAPLTGTYLVEIHQNGGTYYYKGDESLRVYLSTPSTTQFVIDGPSTTLATRPGQLGLMNLDGEAGDNVQIQWGDVTGRLSLPLDFVQPDGSVVESFYFLDIDLPTLTSTGTYTIRKNIGVGFNTVYDEQSSIEASAVTLASCDMRTGPVATTPHVTSVSPNPVYMGQPFTVYVDVAPSVNVCGPPLGTVAISAPYGETCTVDLGSQAACTLELDQDWQSSLALSLIFSPTDPTVFASSRTTVQNAVSLLKDPSSIAIVSASPNPSTTGQPYTVQATVSEGIPPGAAPPTGGVQISDGLGHYCSFTLPATSCSLISNSAGTLNLGAFYYGDGAYAYASSPAFPHMVNGAPPTIASFNPTSGTVGTSVQILGTNFGTTTSTNQVAFNGTPATVFGASSTQLAVTVPTGATTGPISVTVGSQTATSSTSFTVVGTAPTISGFSPTAGPPGTSVTITGVNFGATIPANSVAFNGTPATVTAATTTQLVAVVPTGATTGPISVTVAGQTGVSSTNFTVQFAPTITDFTPTSGTLGTEVTINGTNLLPNDGSPVVTFDGTPALVILANPTQIVATVPNGAASGPIAVTANGTTATSAAAFTVLQPGTGAVALTITSVDPEPSIVNQAYTVNVSVTGSLGAPTGTFVVGDGTNACAINLPATSCTLAGTDVPVGEVTLIAYYYGDANYATAYVTRGHIVNPAVPTEMCGLDPWATPNDPPGFVPITQLSGIVYTPGISHDITNDGNLSVAVTSPGINATIADTAVDVVGTFAGPVNTGITVNGIVATTVNGQFLASQVPLAAGTNTLTVTATTLPGAVATTTVPVTQAGTPSPVTFTAAPSTGASQPAPATIVFAVAVGTLPGNATVQSVSIDVDGDGTYDYTAPSLATLPTTFLYNRSGLYTAALQVTDSNANTYVAYRNVLVEDIPAQRAMLCDVYGYLKDRLNAQDTTGTSNTFQPVIRDIYATPFSALGAQMPNAVSLLGVIVDGQLSPGVADITLVRDSPDQTRSGFPLRMTQGTDGVWRISEM